MHIRSRTYSSWVGLVIWFPILNLNCSLKANRVSCLVTALVSIPLHPTCSIPGACWFCPFLIPNFSVAVEMRWAEVRRAWKVRAGVRQWLWHWQPHVLLRNRWHSLNIQLWIMFQNSILIRCGSKCLLSFLFHGVEQEEQEGCWRPRIQDQPQQCLQKRVERREERRRWGRVVRKEKEGKSVLQSG